MRKFTLNRWNWSERAAKWVFVKLDQSGKRTYYYQKEPPQEFIDLSMELTKINQKLMATKDVKEKQKIFEELMKITQRMQSMREGGI